MHKKPFIKRKRSLFPKSLGDCIQPITQPAFSKKGLAGNRIITDWQSIVGSTLANRCTPVKLSFASGKTVDGTLTIAAENGFATELQHMQPLIIEKLATYFGYRAVSRIKISHTFARTQSKPKEKYKATNKPALSHAHNQLIGDVRDPELKNALQSLASTLTEKNADK